MEQGKTGPPSVPAHLFPGLLKVIRISKTSNAGAQADKQWGRRPGDNQPHLEAAGKKSCPSPQAWGHPTQHEAFTEEVSAPSAPQECGMGQEAEEGFVTGKAH